LPSLTLEKVYDEHFRYVYKTLRRLGVPASEVEDASQEVFLVVHRKLQEFEGRGKLSTWLFSICYRNASERRRRARVRMIEVSDDDAVQSSVDPAPDAAAHVAKREGMRVLEEILERMSLEQRAVFTLYELEGLEGDEIASALELPKGTVYSRLRTAREVFARCVERFRIQQEFARA
jgi:RNA polymerase sigma-70 factor (ECF subfamily)